MIDISIVIPAFNEASKIGRDVEEAGLFIGTEGLSGEVVVVDDGSGDGTAEAARSAKAPPGVPVRVIRLEKNAGKGFALKTGVLASSGEVVICADAGTCVPYRDALPSVGLIKAGELDAALASRRLEATVICRDRPLRRRLLGWTFRWAAAAVAGLPRRITDPQCGFKVYSGDVASELFSGLETPGFVFEIEILLKALRRGCRIVEFPVTWTCDPDSRLRPAAQSRTILKELFAVRRIIRKESGQGDGRPMTDNL